MVSRHAAASGESTRFIIHTFIVVMGKLAWTLVPLFTKKPAQTGVPPVRVADRHHAGDQTSSAGRRSSSASKGGMAVMAERLMARRRGVLDAGQVRAGVKSTWRGAAR